MVRVIRTIFLSLSIIILTVPLFAQQTGSISGKVTASDGSALPGVTVEARSNVLPQARVSTTDNAGEYRLPALIPGSYNLQFSLGGMQTVSRRAEVLLGQNTPANATLGVGGLEESITVTAETSLVDRASTEIKSGLSNEQMQALPIGQEYRDLVKLIPGIQVTQDQSRGPSAGGSGQDNTYNFDGANVTWPLFGVLAADPSSHDIAQINVIKGGAKAIDFDRSGGFSIDSLSKSGTSKFSGQVTAQVKNHSMTADQKAGTNSIFDEDRTWATVSLGGPILGDRLFFYGSYYRPERKRANRANLYGELPEYESERNEGFGKLTFTPIQSLLLNVSYRDSQRSDRSNLFGSTSTATTGTADEVTLKIGNAEGSWIVNQRSFVTAKLTTFANHYVNRPDNVADVTISTARGTQLDINNLDRLGLFGVPAIIAGQTAYNAFVQPFIDKYGYISPTTGLRTGGGAVGFASLFNDQDFKRRGGQVGYNLNLGTTISHDLHVGYQRFTDSEDLLRSSNGWGVITVPGGRINCPANACGVATPAFYQVAFQQQTIGAVPVIHSEYKSHSIELNDTARWGNWSFNLGVLASNDTLYGQGLEKADNLAGFVSAPGKKYEMYNIPFEKMIQPRVGATWAYNGSDTVYGSYSIYNPPASSLPRAASWDRNLAVTINAYFDADGKLIGTAPVASSSGKLFMPDLKPRTITEYLIGTGQELTSRWSGRLYGRYRHGDHFWEDINNDARVRFNPPEGTPRELYMPDLQARRIAIGRGTPSGDTYVIADLDGAFTKYYEATLETDWRGNKSFLKGSYTWSHYYGNFDQDSTSVDFDDSPIFIGSSALSDGAGRQIWDNKYGDLRGDRRHMLKVFGSYGLPWNATAGALAFYQSGQPWEAWSFEPYRALTTSTSDQSRNAEPSGSRLSPSHHQLDLNYTQNLRVSALNLQLVVDLFNLFDNQTGYNMERSVHRATFGVPRNYWAPRQFQVTAKFQF